MGVLAGAYTVHNSYKEALLKGEIAKPIGITNVSVVNSGFTYSTGKVGCL